MSHKDIAKVALGLILSLAITFFVIVIGVMLVQAGYYFGGYWLSIPVGLAYAYGILHLVIYWTDRID